MADLLKALELLDPDDEGHWTVEGLPRVDVVAELVGSTDLTRQAITEADPGYSREAWREKRAALETDKKGGDSDQGGKPKEPPAADTPPEIQPALTDAEALAADFDSQAKAKMVEIREAEKEVERTQALVLTLTREHDNLVFQRERANPSPSNGTAISEYIASQNQLRLEQHQRRTAALKLIDPKDLAKGAAIDRAFARKNTRGTRRPVVPAAAS